MEAKWSAMNAGRRLALYGAGLVAAFAASLGLAHIVVPDSVVAARTQEGNTMNDHTAAPEPPTHQEHGTHPPQGLSVSRNGYVLTAVHVPNRVGQTGRLNFRILDPAGQPVTAYRRQHEKDLHLIVVRSDGARFRHVHPSLDASTGSWSLPWTWQAAGVYRLYADFLPAGQDDAMTLTRTIDVAGSYAPRKREPQKVVQVDGYTVTLSGDLAAGEMGDLTASVSRDGEPVTTLQPYLGAFGHLVALRDGDLAYLHVHPEGDAPAAGQSGGPDIGFMATAPSPGRYLLYLDFRVDGQVHTAEFVVDAERKH
jgi:hypothetical protein